MINNEQSKAEMHCVVFVCSSTCILFAIHSKYVVFLYKKEKQ